MFHRTLVTAALPYANGPLHLGHIAGAYLPADIFVRFKRLTGEDIVFICGSDEYGVAITIAAQKAGVTPKEIIDKYHNINKAAFERFGISFDYYGRTSSETHKETAQEFFTYLNNKGIFKVKVDEQLYDESAEMFLPDRYVKGTCPVCGFEEAYGDQCEKCGSSLSTTQLINPVSAISGSVPVKKRTKHWYLPLNELQPFVEEWIATKSYWKSNVLGQVKSFLTKGLEERAITRDLTWGIPVPLPDAEGKVLYVWLDAPIGYVSATKEWSVEKGNPDLWKMYWQSNDTRLVHFIGKDNIVFHCVMFPSILKLMDTYVLPENVPANEFLNLEGKKLSTSRGYAVWLHEFLEEFEGDLLRYALGSTMPENKDSDFSWKEFQAKVNSELADVLGNFVFRTTSFIHKYYEGIVPTPSALTEQDSTLINLISETGKKTAQLYDTFSFKEAILETMNLARAGNKYFTDNEPWKTRKTNPERCATSLYVCAQVCAALSVYFEPILPNKMKTLREQFQITDFNWNKPESFQVKAESRIATSEILFKKIEDDVIEKQLEKLAKVSPVVQPKAEQLNQPETIQYEPVKVPIDYEDFAKLDLRVGKVLDAKKVEKSKKLLHLTVDLGFEKRTILSGIAEHYEPEQLIGKSVTVVANLKPRKIMGVESNGMLLFSESPTGELIRVSSENLPGTQIS